MRKRISLRGGAFDCQDVLAWPSEVSRGIYIRHGVNYYALGEFDDDGLMIFRAAPGSPRTEQIISEWLLARSHAKPR